MKYSEQALALCYAIEECGASDQLTKCSIMVSDLRQALLAHETALALIVYPSIEAANDALGPCPKPLANPDGGHWFYVDNEAHEQMRESEADPDYLPCICKTCSQKMRLSSDAEELPF